MLIAWDLHPKDGGLQLVDFGQSYHAADQVEPQRAAAGRFLPCKPVGHLSDWWLVAKVS